MKIAVCSDLHLEFQDINLKNEEGAEVLILGGDIMTAQDLHDHPPVHPNAVWSHLFDPLTCGKNKPGTKSAGRGAP